MTVPGQGVVNYTFDNANRLTQITQGSTTVSFSYDNANRRTTLTLPNGTTTSYSYDNASQLTGLAYATGSTTLGNLTYGYDLAGRRVNVGGSFATTNLPNVVSTTAYNANNQLTSWGTANLFYDVNGNMTSDGTHSYAWDARNHMKQIDSGTTASFVYDPLGRRVSKNILGTTTNFLYDGANTVQEIIGGTNTANSLAGGLDEVFQRTDSAGARSFLTDALGSSIALADSTGTIQTQYSFDPFGNTTTSGASTTSSFAYTGRELDSTGLYFNRARYYNTTLQRFISEDPIGFSGGDTNLYAYVWNSPTNFVDPGGQFGWPRHVQITNDALRMAGLSPDPGMAQQVAAVDLRTSQGTDADATNTHAMSGITSGRKPHQQSCEEAFQGTQDQIARDVNAGDLTKALHTIQDAYSPSHYGFQPWDGGFSPLHIPSPGHMRGDFFPPQSAIDAATAASAQFLRDITQNPSGPFGPINPRRYLPANPCGQ